MNNFKDLTIADLENKFIYLTYYRKIFFKGRT